MKRILLLVLAAGAVSVFVTGCKSEKKEHMAKMGGEKHYIARLTGEQATPPVMTKAHGEFTMKVSHKKGEPEVHYKLTAGQINDVTAAHIHLGKPGESGPPVVMLFQGPKKAGEFNGTVAEGTFDKTALVGPLAGKTIGDLMNEIHSGDAYVNIHTDAHPDGEIRGEIVK